MGNNFGCRTSLPVLQRVRVLKDFLMREVGGEDEADAAGFEGGHARLHVQTCGTLALSAEP